MGFIKHAFSDDSAKRAAEEAERQRRQLQIQNQNQTLMNNANNAGSGTTATNAGTSAGDYADSSLGMRRRKRGSNASSSLGIN